LGLPPGLTTVALYSKSAKLKLPLKAITEEFQVGKGRLQMMLRYSRDPHVREIDTKVKSGRKWKASQAVDQAIETAKLKEVIGATQTGKQGFGYGKEKRVWWSKGSDKEKTEMVIHEIRQQSEELRVQEAVQQRQQGQWTTWKMSYKDLFHGMIYGTRLHCD